MKNSKNLMTLTDYVQHAHIWIDRFSAEWRALHYDEPEHFPLQMSQDDWNNEFFSSPIE